jgi:hypothetical protein
MNRKGCVKNPIARPLPLHRTTQMQNKRTQTHMPSVGFESTIPVFERTKTVHALDSAATVIGTNNGKYSLLGNRFVISNYTQPLLGNAFANKHIPTERNKV